MDDAIDTLAAIAFLATPLVLTAAAVIGVLWGVFPHEPIVMLLIMLLILLAA